MMPEAMMRDTQFPADTRSAKPRSRAATEAGLGRNTHRDLGDDTEKSLRSREDAKEVVTVGIEVLAADPDDLARHQDDFQAQEIVGGDTVLETVHAARIFGDIATDRTGELARWIGRVIEPLMVHFPGNRQIGDTRLGGHTAVGVIDIEDAVELAQTQ